MATKYRELLKKVRDLKLNKDDMPPLTYEDENDLLEDPIIIEREHLVHLFKRFKQERITQEDIFDWVHFIWFSDYFTCVDEDADCITSVIQMLEELEEEGGIKLEDAQRGIYALEHNEPIYE
jgi:hypothetical protein